MASKKIVVIGSGFAGLSAAISLADEGHEVTVLEKNEHAGGRARQFQAEGFTFDMGPSWYWMPDVINNFFERFGKKASDYYQLKRLEPSYRIFFGSDDKMDVPANKQELYNLFDSIESGSSGRLKAFLKDAGTKYRIGMHDLVMKPGQSIMEFASWKVLKQAVKLDVFKSFHSYVRKYFSHPKLIQLMEFPILFLGAVPRNTPALYSLMNYADIELGTWYPMGGMHKLVEGMLALAKEKGVTIQTSTSATSIEVENGAAKGVQTSDAFYEADTVVAGADYHFVERNLLAKEYRMYDDAYWDKRTMAPSSLIFYLGVNKRLKNLQHHNLFFDQPFDQHAREIYQEPGWPTDPLFYVCCPSVTDDTVAPAGSENLFVLMPVAPGLQDNEATRERYFDIIMERLEKLTGQTIRDSIVYKRSYAHNDFAKDYNAFKGNAYGLANTLMQTAIFKPSLRSNKVNNLYFTGQLTVPGPGVPPSLISGQLVSDEVTKKFNN